MEKDKIKVKCSTCNFFLKNQKINMTNKIRKFLHFLCHVLVIQRDNRTLIKYRDLVRVIQVLLLQDLVMQNLIM